MVAKLSTLRVRALLKDRRPGYFSDGGGLYLQVKATGSASWLFRFKIAGKGHLMGLGPERDVSLAEARDKAREARRMLLDGRNPLAEKRAAKAAPAPTAAVTFADVARKYIEAHRSGWNNVKHAAQWESTIARYVLPVLGALPVVAVDTEHVMAAIEPLWSRAPETASRLRGRIEAVLDYAATKRWRTGENPARWRGHLSNLLAKRSKVASVAHHPAMPWRDVPAFMASLRAQDGLGARALEFAILTAARSGEVRGATWGEIDLATATWAVPGERMKAGRDHRVPLSEPALAILHGMRVGDPAPHALVFPSPARARPTPLSDMTLAAVLRRMGRSDVTVHGFRSAFRDWCGETTAYPTEVAEAALAHVKRDKVEAAYARSDLFGKRKRLMADWAAYLARPAATLGEVVPLRA